MLTDTTLFMSYIYSMGVGSDLIYIHNLNLSHFKVTDE